MTEPIVLKAVAMPMDIIAFVARSAGITMSDIRGTVKSRIFVRARAVVSVVLRERGLSFTKIGGYLCRDHSTIVHAVNTFAERYKDDPIAQKMLDYARYEFIDVPPERQTYKLATIPVGGSRDYTITTQEDYTKLGKAAHGYNARGSMYFKVRTIDSSTVTITRLR